MRSLWEDWNFLVPVFVSVVVAALMLVGLILFVQNATRLSCLSMIELNPEVPIKWMGRHGCRIQVDGVWVLLEDVEWVVTGR